LIVTNSSQDVTVQVQLDSYIDAGTIAAAVLVNGLTPGFAHGRPMADIKALEVIRTALAIDPPSVASLRQADVPGFIALAKDLRAIFENLELQQIDAAARRINALLAKHPATPHLAKENGVWRMHHHAADVAVLPMWISICAEGLARMIGAQHTDRLGLCAASKCDRVFVDTSKNATRRFCSISCQNRTKTAASRARKSRQTRRAP
jgi:predicted RNA-binding Zn ribbon-like protein